MPHATAQTEEQTTQSKPARDQTSPVSGPSFLGLADESNSTVAYLLEDDLGGSHWGRAVVLVGVLGCVTAAAWHWRHDLRDWAAKFSHQSSATQTEQVSSSLPHRFQPRAPQQHQMGNPLEITRGRKAPRNKEADSSLQGLLPSKGIRSPKRSPFNSLLRPSLWIKRRLAEPRQQQGPRRTKGSLRPRRALSLKQRPAKEPTGSPKQGGGLQPAGTAAEQGNTSRRSAAHSTAYCGPA